MGHGQFVRRATAVLVMGTWDRAAAHVKAMMLLNEPKKFLATRIHHIGIGGHRAVVRVVQPAFGKADRGC